MKKNRFFVLVFAMMLFSLWASVSYALDYMDVSATGIRKIVVAVPYFTTSDQQQDVSASRSMADLLGKALEIHGFINLVPTGRFAGSKQTDWKALGVDYTIMGEYALENGALMIQGQIFDVAEDRLLKGRRYQGKVLQKDDMVLRLADALILEFTGEPGISRTSIAYISDVSGCKEVYLAGLLGKTQRQVTMHRNLCVAPRFTPDGVHLAYSSYHRGNQNLYITDLRQNKITRVLSRQKGMNLAPAFSPNGQQMVATLSKDGNPDLFLMDQKGEVLRKLTSRAGINVTASYSPDGQNIVFTSDRSGRPQVYRMNMVTNQVKRLTYKRKENTDPVWSPKGDLIAFTGLVDGRYQLFVMKPDGSNEKQLTSSYGNYEDPSWSPDSKMLVFSRTRNGKSDTCIIGKNGEGVKVILPFKGNKTYPQWSPRTK